MKPEQQRILVIKLGALGDFIQALGPMKAIRNHHQGAAITLLTTKNFADMGHQCGYFNTVHLDTRPRWFDVAGWRNLRAWFNQSRFTHVYDLQNNDRTAFYLNLFHPKPIWVGSAKGATIRNTSPERTMGKAFDGHVQTLAMAGITGIEPDTLAWARGRDHFAGLEKPYILIVPGSAPKHPEKRWPAHHYVALCHKMIQEGFQPVLIGTAAEADLLNTIQNAAPVCLNLCGRTQLFDIAALARNAASAVGNDTGPMHVIAQAGCPAVILFSKNTNPQKHAPIGDHVVTLQTDHLEDLTVADVWAELHAHQHASP